MTIHPTAAANSAELTPSPIATIISMSVIGTRILMNSAAIMVVVPSFPLDTNR
jgi:hypothetical protein